MCRPARCHDPDLHAAWAYAAEHDRPLAVELAAVIYDFAYQRQRLDLLDWGRQVAQWDVDHPDLSQALATAAAGAWAAGDLADRRDAGVARDRPPTTARNARVAPGRCRRRATWRCSPGTSTKRSGGSRSA